QRTPVQVGGGHKFRSVTVGRWHSCGVATDDRAYCWGDNRYGQLGDSVAFTSRAAPFRVAGGRFYKWLEAGNQFNCGVTTAGKAFCWGNGRVGQLGNGKTYLSFWPRAVSGGVVFRNIAAGAAHACGVATDGQEWCWGANTSGQLGDGTTTPRLAPWKSATGVAIAKVAGGGDFTCGLTGAGKAWCWGNNAAGQVGDGTTITPRLTPRAVVGP
ncbi:MAG TPA: hypothetical protein VEB59_11995, partial [Gemmatimonadales bacterium]|nr:hypothetical protein [Gemmatimonadales bacterium]